MYVWNAECTSQRSHILVRRFIGKRQCIYELTVRTGILTAGIQLLSSCRCPKACLAMLLHDIARTFCSFIVADLPLTLIHSLPNDAKAHMFYSAQAVHSSWAVTHNCTNSKLKYQTQTSCIPSITRDVALCLTLCSGMLSVQLPSLAIHNSCSQLFNRLYTTDAVFLRNLRAKTGHS